MPRNYPRVESRLGRGSRQRLEALRQELMQKSGKYISMSRLVEMIIEAFLDQETCLPIEKK